MTDTASPDDGTTRFVSSCADETTSLPGWLEGCAIDDAHMEGAYEGIGPQARAMLKQTIARLHVFWGEHRHVETRARMFPQGFSTREDEQPADYAFILCHAAYPHPTALLAAVMPAILAGAPHILPCFFQGTGEGGVNYSSIPVGCVAPSLLAAMELAGVEQCFTLTEAQAADLFSAVHSAGFTGRVAALGAVPDSLPLAALRLGVPVFVFPTTPASAASPWIWPDMGPSWFRTRRVSLVE